MLPRHGKAARTGDVEAVIQVRRSRPARVRGRLQDSVVAPPGLSPLFFFLFTFPSHLLVLEDAFPELLTYRHK